MKLHRNAKTTPTSRLLLVQRVLCQGWRVDRVAEAAGVSVRTVQKWIARYRAEGEAGLEDRSSRPSAPAHQTPAWAVTLVQWLREHHGVPAWAIGHALDLPRSTVSAWLRRLGLNQPSPEPAAPIQRYEWPHPGDMIHVDIKSLGRIAGVGHRIHGDRQRRHRGVGWEYVHVAVDDHSRVAYVEILADQGGASCGAFLTRAVAWFAAQGIPVVRVLSDNGPGYLSGAFQAACAALGVRHRRTRIYTPRTNGKAERFIQTLLREWAYARAYVTSADRQTALAACLEYYNRRRPHAGLNYEPPWSRLTSAA